MAQFIRPDGNITQTNFTGGFAEIDEASASDTDFAYGANNTAATLEVSLQDIADPSSSSGHVVRVRTAKINAGAYPGTGGANVVTTVLLLQGTTTIATIINGANAPDAWTTTSYTLSAAEADAITNYNDLRIRMSQTASGGSPANRRGSGISWAEMELPDALTPVSATYVNPYEGTQRLSPTTALSFEAIQRLASTYLKSYENLQRASQIYIEPWSALQGIVGPGSAGTGSMEFSITDGADDGSVGNYPPIGGASYPPTCDDSAVLGETITVAKNFDPAYTTFTQYNALLRFDTSALPDDAVITGATLQLYVSYASTPDSRNLTLEWYNWTPAMDCGDYSTTVVNDAHAGTSISTITTSALNDFELTNLTNINKTGYTGLRFHISGGEPTDFNGVGFSSFEHSTNPAPKLIVDYVTGANNGELSWESRGWVTSTPILPYEAITRLVSQYLESYENLQALASSNVEAWEALTGLSSVGGLPEESLQSISATSIEPYEGLTQIGNTWINPWEAEAVVSFKQTGVARLSLEPGGTPQTRTLHYIAVRARITNAAEVGTLRLRLYEGATPRSAELETVPLTDSFATYLLQIPDADAEDITDYSNLEIRMYGYASTGDSADYEVAEVWLQIPIAGTFLQVTYDTPYEALKGISALADSPYESVIRLTAISIESYENLQGIASTQEEPYEALTGLSAIFDDPMESIQPISQTVTTPYENLQGIAALMGIPYSSLVGLSAANSLPWEAMQPQGVIASFELAYEALGSFATQRQLSWESLVTGITQTFVAPYENLLGLQSLFGTPYDALGAVSQTAPINWESLQGISLASLLAHEALQVLSTMAQVSYESTLPVSSSYVEPYEALAALSQSTGIPYEALVGLSSSTSLPWEGMSISGVLSTYEIAYEALQRLSATIGIPEESLQALQSTAQTAYESLVGLSTQSLVPWEASEITGLTAQYQIPWEAIGSLLATTNVPYETVQYIVSTATSPYEALLGIARLDDLWWDALGSLAAPTAIPYEARGWITNDLVLSYEALQALSATTEIPLEALIRLSLTGQLSWESLSQLVEEHILEGVLFSHLYGRLFRHVDGHAMTHLATEPKQHVSGVLFQPTTTRLRRFR